MEKRKKEIINASWIAIFGNALLSLLKISLGLIAGSLAVVGDGIDSASDIVTSLITLLTAKIISKPPDIKHPYGYERADTIAAKALSFVIFFAGAQLGISTILKIVEGRETPLPSMLAIYITIASIVGKLLLSWHLHRIGRRTQSSMLIANAKNMQNDVIISVTVLMGLAFTFIFKLPVMDTITALAVSIWIIKTAFQIFMQTNLELMDGMKNPEIYKKVFDAINSVEGVHNPHRVRIRQTGNLYILDIDIEVDGDLTVKESHQIAHRVESKIKDEVNNIYDMVIHIEPVGDINKEEKFGITKKDLS
jgi:cation diffusion facilitator family transporter